MCTLQADLLRDLLDDLSDAEPAPATDAGAQTSNGVADPSAQSGDTAEPQAGQGPPAGGARASELAVASAVDLQPSDSNGNAVLSLPDDVLLSVLRRCARADWLSLACSCRALRAAATQDALWLTQPELQQSASAAASPSQQAANPSVTIPNHQHSHTASASEAAALRTAQGVAAPGLQPKKRKRVRADPTDASPTPEATTASPGPAGDRQPAAAALAAEEEEVEQEPGVGSGGTYLGMLGPSGSTESCEAATAGRCNQDPQEAAGVNARSQQPNGTRLYYQRGAARGQQRSLQAALQRGFAATAWLSNLGVNSVRVEPDQTALPLSVAAGAGGSPCLRYAPGAGALSLCPPLLQLGCGNTCVAHHCTGPLV